MLAIGLCLSIGLTQVLPEVESINVRYSRPSAVLAKMSHCKDRSKPFARGEGLVPQDTSVYANDLDGTLILRGSKEGRKAVSEFIKLFDINPIKISFKAVLKSPEGGMGDIKGRVHGRV